MGQYYWLYCEWPCMYCMFYTRLNSTYYTFLCSHVCVSQSCILCLCLQVATKSHHFHLNTCRSVRSACSGWTRRVTWPPSCQPGSTFLPPWPFFVKLPSFYRYRGGSELMDGEWQHVTLSSTLSCGAIPAKSHRPAHVTWQLYSAALWTLSIWMWSLDMLVDEGNVWERKSSGDVDHF